MQLPYNKLSIKWIQFWKDDVLAEESDKVWDLCDQEVIGFCCRWTEDVWGPDVVNLKYFDVMVSQYIHEVVEDWQKVFKDVVEMK